MKKSYIIKKLFNNYTKQYLPKIFLSVFFSLCVAAATSAIAWLLDPAIEKICIEKDNTLLLISQGNSNSFYCQRIFTLFCKGNIN